MTAHQSETKHGPLSKVVARRLLPPIPVSFPTNCPQLTVHQNRSLLSDTVLLRVLLPCPRQGHHSKAVSQAQFQAPCSPTAWEFDKESEL